MTWFTRIALMAAAPYLLAAAGPDGVANFRDIGGYTAEGGRKIKTGVVFRSGELSGATGPDQEFLAALKIRYEIDLRTDGERSAAPSRWGSGSPEAISISVGQPANGNPMSAASLGRLSQLKKPEDAKAFMAQTTARLAIDGAGAIGEVVRDLAKGDEPALIHCTAGKDRTGVAVAVLMTLLGASREDVYREYMRSNEAVQAQIDRQKARVRAGSDIPGMSAIDPAVLRVMMGTDTGNMDAVFAAIDAKYGSFEGYTRDGLKVTPAEVEQLRGRLLER